MNEINTAFKKISTFLSSVFFVLLILVGGGIIFHNVYFTPVKIVGSSMEPNLQNQQFGIMDTSTLAKDGIDRFDVIIIQQYPNIDRYIIKRVIGLPGEEVLLKTNDGLLGQLFIDGAFVDQTFIDYQGYENVTCAQPNAIGCTVAITLEVGEYFVMGDNRGASYDSRVIGPIAIQQIIGVLFAIEGHCEEGTSASESGVDLSSCAQRIYQWPQFF